MVFRAVQIWGIKSVYNGFKRGMKLEFVSDITPAILFLPIKNHANHLPIHTIGFKNRFFKYILRTLVEFNIKKVTYMSRKICLCILLPQCMEYK